MDIQLGKAMLPAAGSAATQTAPQAGASAPREPPATAVQARAPAATAAQPPSNIEAARQVARQINDFLDATSKDVKFTVDSESHEVIVRIVDSQTSQVIRQIPSEEMIAISKALDRMSGLLLKQEA